MKHLKLTFAATVAILLLTLFTNCNKASKAIARYEVLTEKGTSIVNDADTTYELETEMWVATHSYPTGDFDYFESPNAIKKYSFGRKDTIDVVEDNFSRILPAYKGVIIKKQITYGKEQPDKKEAKH